MHPSPTRVYNLQDVVEILKRGAAGDGVLDRVLDPGLMRRATGLYTNAGTAGSIQPDTAAGYARSPGVCHAYPDPSNGDPDTSSFSRAGERYSDLPI
jgi:hypothetical protein